MSIAAVPFEELAAQTPPTVRWLWHGYLARGSITLLTSQWKSGKTTLLSILLGRLKTGGDLAGLRVAELKRYCQDSRR